MARIGFVFALALISCAAYAQPVVIRDVQLIQGRWWGTLYNNCDKGIEDVVVRAAFYDKNGSILRYDAERIEYVEKSWRFWFLRPTGAWRMRIICAEYTYSGARYRTTTAGTERIY